MYQMFVVISHANILRYAPSASNANRVTPTHAKIRFLYHFGEHFTRFSAEAIWDDAKIGIQHLTAFEKIAVVTNIFWVKDAMSFLGVFLPCPVSIPRITLLLQPIGVLKQNYAKTVGLHATTRPLTKK
jgi:hypothetical protein